MQNPPNRTIRKAKSGDFHGFYICRLYPDGFIRSACIITLILLTGFGNLYAQVREIQVIPGKTDPAIRTVHGAHIAMYDPSVPSRKKLILMIEGTGARAFDMRVVDSTFAVLGYHAVSLDYENNVITAGICNKSGDSACYDHYHEEIITGKQVSGKVRVNRTNSILHRFRKLIAYLAGHNSSGGWKNFTENGKLRWDRIIVAGHSQGSGHAAYIGKKFNVSRVMIFSGPQDYRGDLKRPAGWLSDHGKTPPDRYFAFLNVHDPFNIRNQMADCDALMRKTSPDTITVRPATQISGTHHLLVTDIQTENPHTSTIYPEFQNVWEYMLTAPEK